MLAISQLINEELPEFIRQQGAVELDVLPLEEWFHGDERCRLSYHHTGTDRRIELPDLGAGVRRWIEIAAELACRHAKDAQRVALDPASGMLITDQSAVRAAVESVKKDGSYDSGRIRLSVRSQPTIVLIDEPEQHLHPSAQHDIASWCVAQARRSRAVVVATHSPAFLALAPEQAQQLQVVRRGDVSVVKPLPDVHGADAVDRAHELGCELGLGRDALAQLTRAVVVVEGEWDRKVLYAFSGEQLRSERALVVPLQGSNELFGVADAAVIPALGVPVIAHVVDDETHRRRAGAGQRPRLGVRHVVEPAGRR